MSAWRRWMRLTRMRMEVPRVFLLERWPDGIFLDRYDEAGDEVGDTWHQSVDDAREQALPSTARILGRGPRYLRTRMTRSLSGFA